MGLKAVLVDDEPLAREGLRSLLSEIAAIELVAECANGYEACDAIVKHRPDVLFLDDPTRGVDVGAKQDIYDLIDELASRGKGVILVSSELPELLRCSDRILVLREGCVTGILDVRDATQEKIMSGLDSLVANNIHISTLIIDDNWQSLDGHQGSTSQFQRGWKDFEATTDCFPSGLKAGIATIRAKHPQIRDIAVWHALLGYWGGVSPDGNLAKTYKIIEVKKQPGVAGGTMFAIDPSDAHRMYDDFYTFLSSCGVTGVKTDAQFMLDLLASIRVLAR